MRRHLLAAASLALASGTWPSPGLTQSTTDAAKADGKAFGRDRAAAAQDAASTEPDASRVPGFGGVPGQSGYFDDPDRMAREAASQATSNTGYRTMRDSMDRRARFAPVDLDATIARSSAISDDPLAYTSGMTVGGTQGRCVPLPPGSSSSTRYFATCNVGYSVETRTASCTIPLAARVESRATYKYYAEVPFHTGLAPAINEFGTALADGTCTNIGRADTCQVVREYGYTPVQAVRRLPHRHPAVLGADFRSHRRRSSSNRPALVRPGGDQHGLHRTRRERVREPGGGQHLH